ncbi:diguanylate cyclase [soil metagenome]
MSAPPQDQAAAVPDPFNSAAEKVTRWLGDNTPIRQWSVSRVTAGQQVHLHVSGDGPMNVGDTLDWVETLCRRMVLGAPHVVPDIRVDPNYADLDLARKGDIAAYAGIMIGDENGELFGVLCGVDERPLTSPDAIDSTLLELMSALLSDVLITSRAHLQANETAVRARSEADNDALTGLLNRRGWDRLAETLHVRHRSFGDPYSVLVVDLDQLKEVNDNAGHAAGDELLRTAARTLRRTVRGTDALARLGGDEFCLLLVDCVGAQAEARVADLRRNLAAVGVAASIGVSTAGPLDELADTLAAADASMYDDKRRQQLV